MARKTAAEKAAETVTDVEKVRKTRDTTPVELLSDFGVASADSIPLGARSRVDNPFIDAIVQTYNDDFEGKDQYLAVQVDNVSRAYRQLHTAAGKVGLGVRVLTQNEEVISEDGRTVVVEAGHDRNAEAPGTVWFRGKVKIERKSKDAAE